MIYLIIAISCSSTIALIFKYSESRGMNRYAVTTSNYAVASLISFVFIMTSTERTSDIPYGFSRIPSIIHRLVISKNQLSDHDMTGWALLIGSWAGVFFFLAFIYYQKSVRHHGVSLAGAFAKMGIFVPMTLSLLFWREIPGMTQWMGMGIAACAIIVSHWPIGAHASRFRSWALLLLFLFGGCAEFSNKIFQHYGSISERPIFLFVTFFLAFALSSVALGRSRVIIRIRDIRTGILVGIPNLFSSYFLIRALMDIPASVAFPVFGAGTIAIISIVGVFACGERLTIKSTAIVILVILSIILASI